MRSMSDAATHGFAATRAARIAASLALGLALIAPSAMAQAPAAKDAKAPAAKDEKAAPKDAKAPAKDAKAEGNKSAWVKLCEKLAYNTKDKDGKEAKNEKNICLTHHERLDGGTGMVIVSAAIRDVEGADKKSLMIMLPLGMAIPPGVKAAVYSKDQWAAAAKNEKIDEKALKPVDLKYSLCHNAGCTAEAEATPELVEQMKTGGGLMVLGVNPALKPIGFPVPLDGFAEALAGNPIDNKEYAQARSQLMKQIRERQVQMAEDAKKERKEAADAAKDLVKDATKDAKSAPDAKKDAKAAEAKK